MKTKKQILTPYVSEHRFLTLMDKSYLIQVNKNELESSRTAEASFSLDHISIFLSEEADTSQHIFEYSKKWTVFLKGYFYLDICDSFDAHENIVLLLGLLSQHGPEEALSHIQGGFYNLYLWDRTSKDLYLHNDRLGLSPQFWLDDFNAFFFSDNQFNFRYTTELSDTALVEFLKFGYLPVSPSLFTDIQRAPAFSTGKFLTQEGSLTWTPIASVYTSDKKQQTENKATLRAKWTTALARYFSRLPSENVGMGLSGGYDSRLLAAFASESISQAIHFGHPNNNETQIAKQIAQALDLDISIQTFPSDVVAQYGPELAHSLQTLTSLENAHVMHLSQTVADQDNKLYLDGFLGGAVLADAYFKKPTSNPFTKLKTLLWGGDFSSHKDTPDQYAEHLYQQDKQAIPDPELGSILTQEIRTELVLGLNQLVSRHWNNAPHKEDLIERLSMITRGRFLIANGPNAIAQHTQVLLPFMDNDILDLSMQTPKAWRFEHGFYNQLWLSIFPSLSTFRKAGTYGRPTDSDLVYRSKSLIFKLTKKLKSLSPRSRRHAEESYFSLEDYLSDQATADDLKQALESTPDTLPMSIHLHIKRGVESGSIRPELILRYLTLYYTLENTHA